MKVEDILEEEEIKTDRELWNCEPEVGYEWDAGNTFQGRWTAKLTSSGWIVFFRDFKKCTENVLATFGMGDMAERQAKKFALKMCDWQSI